MMPTEVSAPMEPAREPRIGEQTGVTAPAGIRDAVHYMPQLEALRGQRQSRIDRERRVVPRLRFC